jgi:hypothetical protein
MEPVLCDFGFDLWKLHHLVAPLFVLLGFPRKGYAAMLARRRTKLYYFIKLALGVLEAMMAHMPPLASLLAPRWASLGALDAGRIRRRRPRGVLRVLVKPCFKLQDASFKVLNVGLHGGEQLLGLLGKLLPQGLGYGKVWSVVHASY